MFPEEEGEKVESIDCSYEYGQVEDAFTVFFWVGVVIFDVVVFDGFVVVVVLLVSPFI